jgi:hypothetical protein
MIITKVLEKIEKPDLELVSQTLDWEISSFKIEQLNWEAFSYKPRVTLRLGYNENELFLKYKVREQSVKATVSENNGKVWEDSCVEMFISPQRSLDYYNLEVSCIGKKLLGFHKKGAESVRAENNILSAIRVLSSLGSKPFSEKQGETEWNVTIAIPFKVFWNDRFSPKAGDRITANFYKCGDKLATPHYLSWQKIDAVKPNFHLPQFFGELEFE